MTSPEWNTEPLDGLVEDILDRRGVTPLKLGSHFVSAGYRVISAKLIKGGRVDLSADEPRFVDDGTYRKWMRTPLLEDDVILTSEAPLGDAAYVREQLDWCLGQRLFAIRTKKDRLHGRFLYYALHSDDVRHDLLSRATGTTAQGIRQSELRRVLIHFPPIAEQRTIARILGTLDDKIEANRWMSETLEGIARALFKSWFVDFDPVRAKAEGRDPGLPKHLADLFPDSFEESELGEIPEGWEVKKLSDLCATQYGYTARAVDEPIGPKFLRVTDINKRNWIEWGAVPYCEIDEQTRAVYALEVGDIVVARMADPGKSAIIEEEINAVFASYLVRLKASSLAQSYYLYGFLKSDLYSEYADGAKSGSVQASMNARVITGTNLVVPPPTVMEQHLQAVLPLRQRLAVTLRQSRTLAAVRDVLLPKLISGEVRVKDADRFLALPRRGDS
jgi:type I restriction enzyme S subunit